MNILGLPRQMSAIAVVALPRNLSTGATAYSFKNRFMVDMRWTVLRGAFR